MRYSGILLLLVFLWACKTDKKIALPEVENAVVTKVLDVSPAYIFYDDTQDDSTFLNRKNLISTTNWLVNVDKRLSLKQVLPHIVFLQNKKRNAELHKNENARNFFTCNVKAIGSLGFLDFTDVNYKTDAVANLINRLFETPSERYQDYFVNYISADSVVFGNTTYIEGVSGSKFIEHLNHKTHNDSLKPRLHLTFNESLSFQDYISYKAQLESEAMKRYSVSNNEYIY